MPQNDRELSESERLRFRLIMMQEANFMLEVGMSYSSEFVLSKAMKLVLWRIETIKHLRVVLEYAHYHHSDARQLLKEIEDDKV